MTPTGEPRSDLKRIEYLLNRDGPAATRVWVERARAIYGKELADPGSFAADPPYKPRFERPVRPFQEWLASGASCSLRCGAACGAGSIGPRTSG